MSILTFLPKTLYSVSHLWLSFQKASWHPIRTHNESPQKNLADAELFSLFYINYTPPRSGTFSSYTFTVCVVHLKQFWGHKNMFRQFACLCLLKRCQMYFVCLHILEINTQTQHLQAWNADSEWHSANVYRYLWSAQMSLTKWLLKFTVCKSVKWQKKGMFHTNNTWTSCVATAENLISLLLRSRPHGHATGEMDFIAVLKKKNINML